MLNNRIVHRKWGFYITLLDRKHFKVKLLRFGKDRHCSLQMHNLRNELWLFLKGNGGMGKLEHPNSDKKRQMDLKLSLQSGDYYHIPIGKWHTFYAMVSTYVLEIQYGDKCVEEDITRI